MRALRLLLVTATAAVAVPVHAQESPPDTSGALPVEPVSVTVLRDAVRGALVPYAVAEADAVALRRGRTGAFLEEALSGLPGVQVQNRFNFAVGERLAIRGFGPRAQFGVRGVKVLVDGIPATMPDGQSTLDHLDLSSLGRAQVLRGPGSALYGNSAGGVLLLTTALPGPGPVRPVVRTMAGSDGLLDVRAGVRGWIGSTAVRADVAHLAYDGFRRDPSDRGGTYGSADRELVNAQAVTSVAGGALRVTLNAVTLDAENPGSLPRDSLDADEPSAWGGNVAQRTRKDVDQAQLGAAWDGPLAGGRAELAAWLLGRDVSNPIPPTVIDLDRRAGGLRALWGSEDPGSDAAAPLLTWGGGVELELQRDDRRNFENDGGAAGALVLDQLERVRGAGAFVRAGVRPVDRLRVTGALRYDRFRFEAEDRFVGQPAGGDPDDSGSRTMDAVSPTLGAVLAVGAEGAVWANVSTALETPTTTELANRPDGSGGFNEALEPQRSRSIEVGARGRLGARIGWEVAAFRTDVEDDLVPFEAPSGRVFFRNAGASDQEGVEATVEAELGSGVSARAVLSHVDARFDAYEVDGEDFGGNRVPGLAPDRLQATLAQDRPGWFWAAEVEWNDEVPVDDANSEATDAYWLLDVRAGLLDRRVGDLVVAPWAGVANVLDERYTASLTVNAFGGRFYEPGPGRTAHVGLTVEWDRR